VEYFNGTVAVDADGMSIRFNGDLAQGAGPVLEHIDGGWRCLSS
jgi:hypothetical protein